MTKLPKRTMQEEKARLHVIGLFDILKDGQSLTIRKKEKGIYAYEVSEDLF